MSSILQFPFCLCWHTLFTPRLISLGGKGARNFTAGIRVLCHVYIGHLGDTANLWTPGHPGSDSIEQKRDLLFVLASERWRIVPGASKHFCSLYSTLRICKWIPCEIHRLIQNSHSCFTQEGGKERSRKLVGRYSKLLFCSRRTKKIYYQAMYFAQV